MTNIEELLKRITTGWTICKTKKLEPMGFIGYEITIYEKDDLTIKVEIRDKTLQGLKRKLEKYLSTFEAWLRIGIKTKQKDIAKREWVTQ